MRSFVFSVMVAAFVGLPADTQIGRFGTQGMLLWDPVTTDIKGGPEVLSAYEVGIFLATANPHEGVAALRTIKIDPKVTTIELAQVVTEIHAASIADGTAVRIAVRAIDQAANVSEWSDWLEGSLDSAPPATPGGCRLVR